MATKKPSKSDLTFVLGALALGSSLVKNGYEKARYSLGGYHMEDIKVKKFLKGPSKTPSVSLSKTMFVNARLNSIPLGTGGESWILETPSGERFLIAKGNLSFKRQMKPGETYRCKVFGDPDWGMPRIVELIGDVKDVVDGEVVDEDVVVVGD